MKLKRNWFGVPSGTEVRATGETRDLLGYRIIIVEAADGTPLDGPDGPIKEAAIADTFFDETVPRQPARDFFDFI